jgi:hypothetical protein
MTLWSLDEQFVKAIHTALKQLHRERKLGQHALAGLAAVEEQRRRNGWPDTVLGRATALRHTLEEAREALAAQDGAAAALLERRFWRGESVVRLALQQNVAESTLYARQERAIRALARTLWALEQTAQEHADARRLQLARNLPAPTYTRLFGFDEVFARLRAALTGRAGLVLSSVEGPWLVSIEGLGGLGKTALAHRLVTWAAGATHPSIGSGHHFAGIAWETAQQQQFTTWSGIVERPGAKPALTFEALLDSVALQLGYAELPCMPLSQKEAHLRAILKEKPHLIVVDNLETAADHDALLPKLWELANPTRFLLTSRHTLGDHPHVLCLTLNELSETDSLAFIRYEGEERGAPAIAGAGDAVLRQIYDVTGGHPLAIKLVVGQARSLPLERALCRLREASGRHTGELYRFIYWRSWALLSEPARRVLLAMPALAASGGYWENLLAVSGLGEDDLGRAVQELVGMSLLNVGRAEEKQYTIHQLTYTFVMTDLLEEWTAAPPR